MLEKPTGLQNCARRGEGDEWLRELRESCLACDEVCIRGPGDPPPFDHFVRASAAPTYTANEIKMA